MTLANRITVLRILLVPLFAGALLYHSESHSDGYDGSGWYYAAVGLFIVAAFSDGIDGWVARHFGQRSQLGQILDPIADKLLLVTAIVLLGTIGVAGKGRLPLWFPILVVSRDLIIVAGTLLIGALLHDYKFIRPHWTGKVATFFQIAVVLLGLLLPGNVSTKPVLWMAGLVTLVSLGVYVSRGWKLLHTSSYGEPN
ncbi:MAG: CDP-alcohol phosphatidyltransferase family protein [Verrucomicrobia bacterium]|nr:CDP-alcohol phosphatidyltransferase family protein [Verrucomicrobiota bacterium]